MNKLQRIKSFIKETSNYFVSITAIGLGIFAILLFITLVIFSICSMTYNALKVIILTIKG